MVINDALVQNLYYAGEALGQFILGAYDIKLPKMLWHLINTGILKTKADFAEFFKKYSSGFDQSIPAVFYGEGWGIVVGGKFPESVRMAVLEAAFERGMDKEIDTGMVLEIFKEGCKTKNSAMIEKLLSFGTKASVSMLESLLDSDFTEKSKTEILRALFEHGLNLDDALAFVIQKKPKLVGFLVKGGKIDVNQVDEQGMTPLMVAVTAGSETGFTELLALGAKLNVPNKEGQTVLDVMRGRVRKAIAFFDTLTTVEAWRVGMDRFTSESVFENILDTVLALPDSKISSVDKARIKEATAQFVKAREAAELRHEELHGE